MSEPKDDNNGGFQAIKAIFWAFFGIRKRQDHAADMSKLTPRQIIIAGLIGGLIFVLSLVTLVKLIAG